MKKFAASLLLMMTASSAFAVTEYVAVPLSAANHGQYADPCPTAPDVPVPANGLCSEGMVCPGGYEAQPKMCWDGGGFSQCGVVCKTIYNGH
jgi:hypothetical protein